MMILMDKVNDLKEKLDKLEVIKNIDLYYNEIIKNKELVDMIENYKISFNEHIKQDIYTYDEFQKFKKYENEVNLLIMGINSRLKKLNKNGEFYESN